jgi:hypothetical protein
MIPAKNVRYCIQMACEISLCSLRHAFSTPSNKYALWEGGVRVLDLDKGELDPPIGELLNQVHKLALAGGLHFEYALFARVGLKGAD